MSTTEEIVDNVLSHHGIKGQRWGRRRTKSELQRGYLLDKETGETRPAIINNKTKSAAAVSKDKLSALETERLLKTYGTHVVTSKELTDYVNRVQLETKYSKILSERNAKKKNHAKAFIASIVAEAAKNELRSLATTGKRGPIMSQLNTALAPATGGAHKKGKDKKEKS